MNSEKRGRVNIAEPSYTIYSPLWPERLTQLRIKRANVVFTEIGREKRCGKCEEYWPADTEFFHSAPSNKDGLQAWCKGCFLSWRREARQQRGRQ